MKPHEDLVDQALSSLRSQPGPARTFDEDLENRLMTAYQDNGRTSRFRRSPAWAVALACVAVGGVTFAATGGVAKVRSWFMKLEINGEVHEVPMSEDGKGSLTLQTEDGEARVHVERSGDPEKGVTTRVKIVKEDANKKCQEEAVAVRRIVRHGDVAQAEAAAMSGYTLADIGDAEPMLTWTGEEGLENELYILVTEDAGSDKASEGGEVGANGAARADDAEAEATPASRIFLVSRVGELDPIVTLLAAPPFPLVGEGLNTNANLDDDGFVTIQVDDGAGREQVLKFKVAGGHADASAPEVLKLDHRGRKITEDDGGVAVEIDDFGGPGAPLKIKAVEEVPIPPNDE